MRYSKFTAIVLLAGAGVSTFAQSWFDDFETADSASRYNVFASGADYTVDFGYDYGSWAAIEPQFNFSIPSAPNSGGTTKGLKIAVNDLAGARQAVSLFPKAFSVTPNHVMRFDMWMNWNGDPAVGGGAGSTETASFGSSQNGEGVRWRSGTQTEDNLWFSVNGEGGSSATSSLMRDYTVYKGTLRQFGDAGGYAATGTGREDHANAYYQALFPAADAAKQIPGSPGRRWVQVEIRQFEGTTTWLMDGTVIATQTGIPSEAGNVFLGYIDDFNSMSHGDSFVVFDNFSVVPEPASMLALGLGALGVLARRLRR